MKKIKKILVGFLALCMIMSSVRVWPAKAATEVDVTSAIVMEDTGSLENGLATRVTLAFSGYSVIGQGIKDSGSINKIWADNGTKDPLQYVYINDVSMREHVNNNSGTANGLLFGSEYNYPMYLRLSKGSNKFEIYVLSSYIASKEYTITIKAGFEWANENGQLLKVTEDVTYGWDAAGTFGKVQKATEVDVSNIAEVQDLGASGDMTKLSMKFTGYSIKAATTTSSYIVNELPNKNGQNPLEYIYINDKSMSEHVANYDGALGTGSVMSSNAVNNPMYLRVSGGNNFFEIYILSSYLAQGTFEITLKKGFEWANNEGYLLKATKDIRFFYNAQGTISKEVGDSVDVTDSVVVKDMGGVIGGDTTTFTVGFDGYSVAPASGADFYANDNANKNGQDPMEYIYVDGMSLREHINSYTGDRGTAFPMSAGAIYNPVILYVESGNNYMRFSILNSYLEAGTYDVVIKKGFSWANANGQVLKVTEDVRFFYDSNKLLCKDMTNFVDVKNWVKDGNLSCTYISFADKILPTFADAYDVMKESEAWYYLQECISINGRSIRDINTNTDTTGWEFTVFPQSLGAPFATPVLVQQSGDDLIVKIHENYLATLEEDVKITINSNIYLEDIKLCKIPKPITFVYNGNEWKRLGSVVPTVSGWGTQSELKYTYISFGEGVLPKFEYGAMFGDYKYLQEYITFNGTTVKEINETVDTEGWEFTVFPSSADAKYQVPIILYQDGDRLTLKVHNKYLELLETDVYTIGFVEDLTITNGKNSYCVEEAYQFTLDGSEWKKEKDITSLITIEGWNAVPGASELMYTRIYFAGNIFPNVDYGIISKAGYQYMQNYLTINGRRVSDINANTDVSDYEFNTFPSTLGAPYNVPVIVYENEGVLELKVHTKYVESLGNEDIVIGVTGGLTFAGEDVSYRVMDNVTRVVAKGATDIAEQVRVVFWAETGDAHELMYTTIEFGEGVLPNFSYGAIDGAYKNLQDYIVINGKTVRDINTNVDDSNYVYSTFPSTIEGETYKVPVMLFENNGVLEVKIHKEYLKTIQDDGVIIGVLKGLKVTNGETSYVVGKNVTQTLQAAAIDITHQVSMNGWLPQEELMYTSLSFGEGVLPEFDDPYNAMFDDYSYIQEYIALNGVSVKQINETTDTSSYVFNVFPSNQIERYRVPIILLQDGDTLTVKVHTTYLATLGDEITLEVAAGLRINNTGKIYKTNEDVKFKLVSNMWQKLVVVADIDGDGDTTSTDLVRYLRWQAGEDNASINTVFADLDTDNDNDADDIYWVRRVLVGDDIMRRSPSSLYFLSSDGSLDTFLNDFYSRHSRASVTTAIDNMQLGVGSSVWKAWETMSLVWFDNSTANFRSDGLNLIKDALYTMPIDDYGYVWSGSDALEDPNKAPNTGTFGLGWPLPNYSGKHEGDWEFNSTSANGEETSSWNVTGGNKSQANGFLSAEATNSAGVTFETTSLMSLVSTSIASFLEVDVRWNLTGASEYKVYVSWKKSALSQNWSAEYDVTQYAVKTGTMGTQYGEHLYIPVYQISEWSGNIYGLRIIVKPVSGNITGNVDLNFVRCNYDTRQIDNMYSYVDTLKMYYEYTGDTETLEANLNRARKAVMFMQESMTDENGLIDLSNFAGHTGADRYAGRENNLPSSYWDIISMPTDSIYGQIMYYQSLQSLAWLENAAKEAGITVAAPQVKTSSTTKATYSETVDSLKQTADELATYVQNNYWDNAKGRFIDGHDASGKVVDFGSTIYNNMAVAAGMATNEQAEQIASWLNGERAVAGDNSTGSDIYTFEFAPRVTTVDNQTQYVDGHNPPKYGASVQNGGAILFTSYYDMLARFNTAGSDDAYGRLRGMKDWYLKVLNNYDGSDPTQFYRSYYADKEITLQGAGAEGALGLDTEFIENAIVYNIVPEAFFGLGSEDGKMLQIAPQLPTELSFWRMENLVFHGVKYDVETGKNYLTLRNVSDSDSGLYVNVSLQTDKTNPSVYINGKKLSKDAYTVNDGVVTLKVEMRTQRIEIR